MDGLEPHSFVLFAFVLSFPSFHFLSSVSAQCSVRRVALRTRARNTVWGLRDGKSQLQSSEFVRIGPRKTNEWDCNINDT